MRLERKANIIKVEEGLYFPIQLIITKELSRAENLWLKSLTDQLNNREDVQKLLSDYNTHQSENLYQAVMDVVVRANSSIFKEEKKMCEALKELCREEFEKQEQLAEAREKKKIYSGLIRDGILTIQDVAIRLKISEEAVENMLLLP